MSAPSAPRPGAGILPAAVAVFRRELLAEWRTRVAVNSLFLFAFAVLVLVAYTVGPARLSPEDRPTVNAVLLWIVLFFSAMTGLSRTFVHEEDAGTALALRLSAPPPAVLLGKLLANVALLGAVTAFIVPLFVVLMSFEIREPSLVGLVLLLGMLGLASASTFTAALVSKASAKGALFAVLSIPLLLPPLVGSVLATRIAATQADFSLGTDFVKLLVAYDGVVTTAAFLLFDAVWRE